MNHDEGGAELKETDSVDRLAVIGWLVDCDLLVTLVIINYQFVGVRILDGLNHKKRDLFFFISEKTCRIIRR